MNQRGWDPELKSNGLTLLVKRLIVSWTRYMRVNARTQMKKANDPSLDETSPVANLENTCARGLRFFLDIIRI